MAEYISFQPSDFFSTKLYTGNASTQSITGVGFQPDMVWIKNRDADGDHSLQDAVRGTTKTIIPNGTDEEQTYVNGLTAFGADGFSVGSQAIFNGSGNGIVSWNWKAGTTTGIDTTGSTITPSGYTFNQTSGFSVIAYPGNSTAGATLPHGLGVRPDMVSIKRLNTSGSQWASPFTALESDFDWLLHWEVASGYTDGVGWFNDTAPTAVNLVLGTDSALNTTGNTYIAYCWANKKGYSKFGSYLGNGVGDGTFVYTGFQPAFVMVKRTGTTGSWMMYDDKRIGFNEENAYLQADTTIAELQNIEMDMLSNGFKLRTTDTNTNASATNTYVYAAFAKFPIVSSNDVPGVAR